MSLSLFLISMDGSETAVDHPNSTDYQLKQMYKRHRNLLKKQLQSSWCFWNEMQIAVLLHWTVNFVQSLQYSSVQLDPYNPSWGLLGKCSSLWILDYGGAEQFFVAGRGGHVSLWCGIWGGRGSSINWRIRIIGRHLHWGSCRWPEGAVRGWGAFDSHIRERASLKNSMTSLNDSMRHLRSWYWRTLKYVLGPPPISKFESDGSNGLRKHQTTSALSFFKYSRLLLVIQNMSNIRLNIKCHSVVRMEEN